MYRACAPALIVLLAAVPAGATATLLYVEAQMAGGYDFTGRRAMFYSMDRDAPMQKPSLGFDYLQRFPGPSGDVAVAALQVRLAFNRDLRRDAYIEPQVYNAWVRFKTPVMDVWAGHDRPALGLGSYLDSHALLLHTLSMEGFGFDRDWGGGIYRQFDFGDLSVTATTGSGMLPALDGSYLAAARLSAGVLARDNYSVGFSGGYGRILEQDDPHRPFYMYKSEKDVPRQFAVGGVDYAHFVDNFEFRAEALAGTRRGGFSAAALVRAGVNVLPEDRLKLEVQGTYRRVTGRDNYQAAACISTSITGYLTARAMYQYDHGMRDHRAVVQLYCYWKV